MSAKVAIDELGDDGAREIDLLDGVSDVADTLDRLARFYSSSAPLPALTPSL